MADPDPRRDLSHQLYALVMNICESAIAGKMPQAGPAGLTHLCTDTIADIIMTEIEACNGRPLD